ncbi:ArsR/SmtB family transcription factor [Yunchengibacter salinarum]|uniref:ArsR/SmtB family transcription factor n=1 Tax=Yunchengibacter salinarum TaxID=3133399 RepID=UPI0035B69838
MVDDLLAALRAAGETTRLRILALLARGELTVSDLVRILDQSQPRVSRHLKLMVDGGLLTRFRDGAWVFYRLAADGVGRQLAESLLALTPSHDPLLAADADALDAIRAERFRAAQDYFRANADQWDAVRSLHVPEAEVEQTLIALAPEGGDLRLVDVGTGTGRMLDVFRDHTREAVGVDISPDMLAVARRQLERPDLAHCRVALGDMYDLPVAAGGNDLVIFHQVLHFAEQPGLALREAARVLAPGGSLLVADFAPHEEESLRTVHAHRRLGFSVDEMAGWAREAGLIPVEKRHLTGDRLVVTVWRFDKPDQTAENDRTGQAGQATKENTSHVA